MDEQDAADAAGGYELVMPFVAVASVGGPYDDEAFAAGWACAQLDAELAALATTPAQMIEFTQPVRLPLRRQVDLIAMKHGFHVSSDDPSEDVPEYLMVTYARGGEDS